MPANPDNSPEFHDDDVDIAPKNKKQASDLPHVLDVARHQKTAITALLAGIVVNVMSMGIRGNPEMSPELRQQILMVFGLLAIAIYALTVFTAFRLANELDGMASGILYAILGLIPCVQLIVLLILSSKATSLVQGQGFKVGLMGANLREIEDALDAE
jgi:hypothetical protein